MARLTDPKEQLPKCGGASLNFSIPCEHGRRPATEQTHGARPLEGRLVIEAKEKALVAAMAAQEKKGHSVTVIDLAGECSYTDFLVIISAGNERQTAAIAESITDTLREKHGQRPLFREGQGGWTLLDYGDVVVHVFVEETRAYYDLDRVWPKAPRVPVPALQRIEPEEDPRPTALARRRGR